MVFLHIVVVIVAHGPIQQSPHVQVNVFIKTASKQNISSEFQARKSPIRPAQLH